jgi:hypothetical protein
MKPLQPLSDGIVLLAGVKASNFGDEIRTHPRVVMWDSQQQHWLNKDLPSNTRAVFVTRFIGHNAFAGILSQARKRHITIFNPEGTGIIARQVKELLGIVTNGHTDMETIMPEIVTKTRPKTGGKIVPKLLPLRSLIDFSKGNVDNAHVLMARAKELGIDTTMGSLSQMVSALRRKRTSPPSIHTEKVDVSVQMLDNAIKELKDMRQFFIETVAENRSLRQKLDKFKKLFEE